MLTVERLREVLAYDPVTGAFTRRVTLGGHRAGATAGALDERGYCLITIDRVSYYAHRLAWFYVHGEWPPGDLDHWDTDKSNNRLANLREATRSQNVANQPPPRHNTSGYKGVFWSKWHGRWRAYITVNYRRRHLGTFGTAEAAHAAVCAAARQSFGEFARGGA